MLAARRVVRHGGDIVEFKVSDRDRHDRGAARPVVPGVCASGGLDLAGLRRHRARPRHHQALLPHAGRRCRRRSTPGKGSTFAIVVPAIAPDVQAEVAERTADPAPAPGRGTVLIVDDEKATHNLLERRLASAGYHVLHAAGGREVSSSRTTARRDHARHHHAGPGRLVGVESAQGGPGPVRHPGGSGDDHARPGSWLRAWGGRLHHQAT